MADSNAHHHLNEKSILHLHKQFASECARPRRHMIAFIIKLRPNKYTWAWIDISSLCIFLFLFLANRDLLYSARIRHNLHTNGNWKNTARNETVLRGGFGCTFSTKHTSSKNPFKTTFIYDLYGITSGDINNGNRPLKLEELFEKTIKLK